MQKEGGNYQMNRKYTLSQVIETPIRGAEFESLSEARMHKEKVERLTGQQVIINDEEGNQIE